MSLVIVLSFKSQLQQRIEISEVKNYKISKKKMVLANFSGDVSDPHLHEVQPIR
jgi:hypothetical protein